LKLAHLLGNFSPKHLALSPTDFT